ncbi:MAG: ABC transporter permease, partial [Rhodobacteraceae bacterium]|nr:ABC transporter permease [Paracoccaceae bacterium]
MEPLTLTGSLAFLNPVFMILVAMFAVSVVVQVALSFFAAEPNRVVKIVDVQGGQRDTGWLVNMAVSWSFSLTVLCLVAYILGGVILSEGETGIVGGIAKRFTPVWIALIVTFVLSFRYKRKLGLYGKLFNSVVGMIGLALVMFWVFTAVFSGIFDMIYTHDSLVQVSGMKNILPGTPLGNPEKGEFAWYLLGGDNLARDVFSRVVIGSGIVMLIAPPATVFAFMVGVTLGLPAGYFGGRFDTILSFVANLILAFPVILLFYLLVTPEIAQSGLPNYMAVVLFVFPLVFV